MPNNTHLVLKSRNSKVGKIPVSTSSAETCSDSCPLKKNGCYADGGPLSLHWRKVTAGLTGDDWGTFTAKIAALPAGQAWRHNQAGDLPGVGDAIDAIALAQLVDANRGKMGWTYTHKPMNAPAARDAVAAANAGGLTVNLSADTLGEADELAELGVGPVVVVLAAPEGAKADCLTPAGRRVVTCPATYMEGVTCASCLLCARPKRETIVGFPAHGIYRKAAAATARG